MTVIEQWLLEVLACPEDRAALIEDAASSELLCSQCDRAYPVRDGIPVLLLDQARRRGSV